MYRIGYYLLNFRLEENRILLVTWTPVENASLAQRPTQALTRMLAVGVGSVEDHGLGAGNLERFDVTFRLRNGEVLHALCNGMGGIGHDDLERLAVVDVIPPRADVLGFQDRVERGLEGQRVVRGMERQVAHALIPDMRNDALDHGLGHLGMLLMSEPDQHIGLVEHRVADAEIGV